MSEFRAAILAVVSTDAQAGEERYSLPMQLQTCRAGAAKVGADVVAEFSFAHSRSYDALADLRHDSADYDRLVCMIESGAINLLIAYRYDRLGRTLMLQLEMLRLCKAHDVAAWSVSETPNGPDASTDEWMLTVMRGMMAENEVRTMVRRSISGKIGRAQKGLHMAWARLPYGYQVDGDHAKPLVLDPTTAPVVRQIMDYRAKGWGFARIARRLNTRGVPSPEGAAWHHVAVRRIVHNPYYAGFVRFKGEIYKGLHEPLIDAATWATVQRINKAHTKDYEWADCGERLLSGLWTCGACGGAMVYSTKADGRQYARCGRYQRTGGRECVPQQVRAEPIERFVLKRVAAALGDPDAHLDTLFPADDAPRYPDLLLEIEHGLADLAQQEQRLGAAILTGRFSLEVLANQQDALTAQRAALEAERTRIQADATQRDHTAQSILALAPLADDLLTAPPDVQRQAVRQMVYRVVVERGKVPRILWLT